jgi:hypothetical protein
MKVSASAGEIGNDRRSVGVTPGPGPVGFFGARRVSVRYSPFIARSGDVPDVGERRVILGPCRAPAAATRLSLALHSKRNRGTMHGRQSGCYAPELGLPGAVKRPGEAKLVFAQTIRTRIRVAR